MLPYLINILQATTGKTSLHDVTTEQLQQIADEHPYFAAVQLLLAKKMLAENNALHKDAVQKTALYFHNTLLLHYNLYDDTETNDVIEPLQTSEENIATTENEIPALNDIEQINATLTKDINEPDITFVNEDEASVEEAPEIDSVETNERLSNLLKEQAEAFEASVEEAALPVETIPHHRIDYFESQGIQLDPDKEANDKLSSQLRRFTDWLKQMKRINPNLNSLETDVAGEIQAQNMAARSNDAKEVLTEAMAEVLIKQDKPEEAIAIYEKLSFSNPSKTAYFAAKIKELKPE